MIVKFFSLILLQTVLAAFSNEEHNDSQVEETRLVENFLDLGRKADLSSDGEGATPVFLSETALKTDRSFWYRGDKREPSNIFKEGFKARGNNASLIEHVHGNESGPIKDSAYISTSILEDAATRYPKDFIGRSYIYLINPQKAGVDVNQALVLEIDAGRMLREDANVYLIDHEMAVPYQIKKEHIKGAWISDSLALQYDLDKIDNLYSREVRRDSFISNPHYVKPLSKSVASFRFAGAALTTLGIYLDTKSLWDAYKSGDDGRFFGETARVIGGWTGSIALGTHWGKESSLVAWRFTKNPGLTLASGIVGAVAGSVLGYTGGGLIAQGAMEGLSSVWTDLYHTLKQLEPDRSNLAVVDVQRAQSIESNLFAKLDEFWIAFKNELREEGSFGAVIRKHLPSQGPGKPDLINVLRRLEYRSADETPSMSAQRTAEALFGPLQQDIKHPHSDLLKQANIDSDGPGEIFRNAKVDVDHQHQQSTENISHNRERERELERAYSQVYELTDRAKNIRSSLMASNVSTLLPARYYADDFRESAGIANSWALTFNSLGDIVTGRKLAAIGSALSQASAGAALLSAQQASLLQTIGGYSSWISAGAVFVSLFMSDDDDDGNEALQMLMNAIIQLGQALQHVMRSQEQIMELMQVTLMSIHDVDSRLRQMHAESQDAFEFIASLELQNACLSLQDDLNNSNAVSMTTEDRRKALATLERWLKQHLFSPVMTKFSSANVTATLAVEFISKQQQQNLGLNATAFIMAQLHGHLGELIVPSKFTQLPPLLLFLSVSHLFLQVMLKAEVNSDDACSNLLSKLQDVLDLYTELAELIQHSDALWSSLFAQYDHKRNMVGRAIAAANVPNQEVPLHSLVTNDLQRRNLMEALDQMEEIRLSLLFLCEFAFDGTTLLGQKVQALESKHQILTTPASIYYERRGTQVAYYLNNVTDEDIHRALCSGANLNLNYHGGNILNYTGYLMINTHATRPFACQWEVDRIHLALKHSSPSDRLNANLVSTYVPTTTWPNLNCAMRMCSNKSRYGFGLLLIIAGFNRPWDYETLLNSSWWAEKALGTAREYQMFISSTIRKDGVLNRYRLIRAYEYYRACENGEIRKADTMVQEGIDANCVLWLVALLGKWFIFERLQAPVNLSQTLGKFNFGLAKFHRGYLTAELGYSRFSFSQESLYTPLMVAAEHCRADVIEGMIRAMEAGHDIGISRKIHYCNASAATLAFNEKNFDIAKRLADLGAPLEENVRATLSSKSVLPGPLPHINGHLNTELLVKSDTLSQGGKVIGCLHDLSSSMKRFSDAYKWVLNSKIRCLLEAFQKQDVLKRQLEQFENITERIELMSLAGFVSDSLVKQFKDQNQLSKDYYGQLQAKTSRIAKIYHESYDYEKLGSEPSASLKQDVNEDNDAVVDESVLKDKFMAQSLKDEFMAQSLKVEFMEQVSQIAQDFGIKIDKVFELIESAAIHIQSIGGFNDSGILLLGATGTGKSTFLNFMSGCLYRKTKKAGKQMREISRGDEISETSHRSRAQTRFPVVYNHEQFFSLVDLAGFLDNTENTSIGCISSYDIVSALSMNLISTKFKTISGLIACCTEAQLTAERPPLELQETFRNIGRIIKGVPELSNTVKLFVTKHNDLEPMDVIEGLRELASDFSSDEDMCAFLNLFDGEEAANRILFTDVIDDDKRAFYISELASLTPRDTIKFNFRFHSPALIRLQDFVGRIVKLRDELVEKIVLLKSEEAGILDLDMNSMLSEHIPQISIKILDDDSIDSLSREQAGLLEQLTGDLPNLLQNLELKVMRFNEIKRLIRILEAKESIENRFIMDCCNLGLYEP